jgi:hypothetical protein
MEIRCSKLARYMQCAGYAFLKVEELPAGEPAREGTAAGEWLTSLLLKHPIGTVATNGVYITDEMKFYTTPIAENILSRAKDTVLSEVRIDWLTRSGIWIRGQYDAAFEDARGYLCIEDLKYGWGIIDVFENWQLIGYAIGEVIRRGKAFSHISFKIHQPRPHHEDGYSREWIITWEQLLEYKEKIELRMIEIANGKNDLQTGKYCKYCPGAGEACVAFNRLFYKSIEVSTQFFQDSLNEEQIAAQLDIVKRAQEVLKIKSDSLVDLGNSRIRAGKIIPGYVQVNTYSDRQWKSGVSPESIKIMTSGKYDVIEKTFMSPAKAEKMGVSKKLIQELSSSRVTGVKLQKKDGSDVGNKIFGNKAPVTINP